MAIVGLLVAWASCLLFVVLGIPLLAISLVALSARREWRSAICFLLASPFVVVPVITVAIAAFGFVTNTAEILTWGLTSSPPGAIDYPSYFPKRSTGTAFSGFELLRNVPNNATLRALARASHRTADDFWKRKDAFRSCRAAIADREHPPPPCSALHMCAEEAALDASWQDKLLGIIRAAPACAVP